MDEELVPLLSLEEAAELSHLSIDQLTKGVQENTLPHSIVDFRVRIRLSDLEHFKEVYGT